MLFILFSSIAALALAEDMKNLRFLEKDDGEISIRKLAGDDIGKIIDEASIRKNLALDFVLQTLKQSIPATNAAIHALAAFTPKYNPAVPETRAAVHGLSSLLIFCPEFMRAFHLKDMEAGADAITKFFCVNNIYDAAKLILNTTANVEGINIITEGVTEDKISEGLKKDIWTSITGLIIEAGNIIEGVTSNLSQSATSLFFIAARDKAPTFLAAALLIVHPEEAILVAKSIIKNPPATYSRQHLSKYRDLWLKILADKNVI